MIKPEPTATVDRDGPPWIIEVPSAGHLGVIEEECRLDHAGPSLQGRLVEECGLACPACGAAV